MKVIKYVIACMLVLIPLYAYAINISIDSLIHISNAPASAGSKWQVECGGSTGVYNLFTKQFSTNTTGVMDIPVSLIFNTGGSYFCRTAFVQPYGQGPYSTEVFVTILTPTLPAPSLTVIP